MTTIKGLVLSGPKYIPIRVSDLPMKEIYLENDHQVFYRFQNRQTGQLTTGLSLTAFLTLNETGSAAQSSYFTGPTSSLSEYTTESVVRTFSSSLSGGVSSSFTTSVYTTVTQSYTSSFSSSAEGVILSTTLTEIPPKSGDYQGTIDGTDIAAVLSSSLDTVYSSSLFVVSSSVTGSISGAGSLEDITINATHSLYDSFTQSVEIPIQQTAPRAWSIYEVITSGDGSIKIVNPMNLRSVRFVP